MHLQIVDDRVYSIVNIFESQEVGAMKSSFLHKAIFLAVIVTGLSLAGFAQQPAATPISGGQGGTEFMDTEIPSNSRVAEIHVFSGEFIDAIQMMYALPDGRTLMGQRHGGPGGRRSVFRLDSDEYITGISGNYGEYIDSIQIQTNKRSSQLLGGTGGRQTYSLNVPNRNQAVGFTGRTGEYLDAIGLTYLPIKFQNVSKTMIQGGRGGNEFADTDIPYGARITEIRVRSAKNIDSIQAVYLLQDGSRYEGPLHGGSGGNLSVFRLDSDEYITGISGRYGLYIDSLTIKTNKRTSATYGGKGGNTPFNIAVSGNTRAIGFAGRAASYLDAIGLTTATSDRSFSRERWNRFRVPR